MSVRSEVAAALRPHLPAEIRLIDYARGTDPSAPTVMVGITSVTPSTQPQAWRTYEVVLYVLTAKTDPSVANDDLDDVLEDVLYALDKAELPTWTAATRAVFNDTIPGYEVTLTIPVTKED